MMSSLTNDTSQQDPVAAAAPYGFYDVRFSQGVPPQGQANALVSFNSGSLSTCSTKHFGAGAGT
jgi:hypothetical protein